MTSDFLADLDAAVQQKCACLCGSPITPDAPSAYFSSESCAQAWYLDRQPAARPEPVFALPTAAQMEAAANEFFRHINAALASFFEGVAPTLDKVLRASSAWLAHYVGPVLPVETPPSDLREFIAWTRRHRGPGPRPAGRAPARIDPRAGLRAYALGRARYRPAR